jgi:hypothetical protein
VSHVAQLKRPTASLGSPELLHSALEPVGFRDIEEEVVEAPLRKKSAKVCLRFEREFVGALHQMLGSRSEAEQGKVWDEIEEDLTRNHARQTSQVYRGQILSYDVPGL